MTRVIKLAKFMLLGLLLFGFIGCNVFNMKTETKSDGGTVTRKEHTNEMSVKERYVKFLNEKSKEYLEGLKIDTDYNLTKMGALQEQSVEVFFNGFKKSYEDLEKNLFKFKEYLIDKSNYGDFEVDQLNKEILFNVDKTIKEVSKFNDSLKDNINGLINMEKNNFFAELKRLEQVPHVTRMELNKLINKAGVILKVE